MTALRGAPSLQHQLNLREHLRCHVQCAHSSDGISITIAGGQSPLEPSSGASRAYRGLRAIAEAWVTRLVRPSAFDGHWLVLEQPLARVLHPSKARRGAWGLPPARDPGLAR